MTPKQRQALGVIHREIATKGCPPSLAELCTALDIKSKGNAHSVVERLIARGFVERERSIRPGVNFARNLRMTPAGRAALASVDPFEGIPTDLLRAELARRELEA